jgi:hypothetical protein
MLHQFLHDSQVALLTGEFDGIVVLAANTRTPSNYHQ